MRIVFFMALGFLILYSSNAFAFECGNGICENADYWLDKEDLSNCYVDCYNKDFTPCVIDTISGGSCQFRGQTYNLKVTSANPSCGFNQVVGVDVSVGNHFFENVLLKPNMLESEPDDWKFLHDDVMISYGFHACSIPMTTYTFWLTGLCKTEECKLKVDLELSEKDIYKTDGKITVTGKVSLSKNLAKPTCEFYLIKPNGDKTEYGWGGCVGDTFDLTDNPVGKYKYKVVVKDENNERELAEQTAEFIIHECRGSKDCDDGNPCTTNECSGTVQICSYPREDGCVFEDACVPYGTLDGFEYCSKNNEFVLQKPDKTSCMHNYECETNICKEGVCYRTFWDRIRLFLKKLFGR